MTYELFCCIIKEDKPKGLRIRYRGSDATVANKSALKRDVQKGDCGNGGNIGQPGDSGDPNDNGNAGSDGIAGSIPNAIKCK